MREYSNQGQAILDFLETPDTSVWIDPDERDLVNRGYMGGREGFDSVYKLVRVGTHYEWHEMEVE